MTSNFLQNFLGPDIFLLFTKKQCPSSAVKLLKLLLELNQKKNKIVKKTQSTLCPINN